MSGTQPDSQLRTQLRTWATYTASKEDDSKGRSVAVPGWHGTGRVMFQDDCDSMNAACTQVRAIRSRALPSEWQQA